MIIRVQYSADLVNFDHVKTMRIRQFDGKYRIEAMSRKADDIFGIRLAEYKEMKQAICEMKRFYQAYEAGEKTFMFKSEYEKENDNDGSREEL